MFSCEMDVSVACIHGTLAHRTEVIRTEMTTGKTTPILSRPSLAPPRPAGASHNRVHAGNRDSSGLMTNYLPSQARRKSSETYPLMGGCAAWFAQPQQISKYVLDIINLGGRGLEQLTQMGLCKSWYHLCTMRRLGGTQYKRNCFTR